MHILILNWRDPKNPHSGGAEILTQEMAKRWVLAGNSVTQISASFKNAKPKEVVDGVTIIRMGNWWNVHILACLYYLQNLKNNTDIVIDEVHWFPFFSSVYAPTKTVALVCEVATKLFKSIFPLPVAICWQLIEKTYLILYKNVPTMVISESTRTDLLKEGHQKNNIIVLPMGITLPSLKTHFVKEKEPTFITVGRLNRQKGVFAVLDAFILIKKEIPNAHLWFVGSGEKSIISELQKKITKYGLTNYVTFFGFVTEEKKFELMARAHVLMSASVQEGWGLTIPEAALMQTPSVVYDVQGFNDIITNKKDGILVKSNPRSLAKEVIILMKDKTFYRQLQRAAENKAKLFSWDNTATSALQFIKQYE